MNDKYFMSLAIEQAKKARFPFWCVLVKDGKVLSYGKSWEWDKFEPANHAELNAIRKLCNELNTRNLSWVTLYSTCEPCIMCFWASWFSNISKIIYWISIEESSKLFWEEILVNNFYLNENWWNKIEIKWGLMKDEIISFMKEVVIKLNN